MIASIKVKPNTPSAIDLKHPYGPALAEAGSLWPNDSFTARRLTDGSVVEAAEDAPAAPADKPADPAPVPAEPKSTKAGAA